ncbi:MAG: GspH/FimT family pseudopilin [Methylococcaceae bacterium]
MPEQAMSYQQRGFTLIELSVVLLIIVLGFGAISIGISSGNKSSQLKAAARDMASALRYARGQALISHKEVAVAINLAENNYNISSRDKVYHFSDEIDLTLVIAQDEFKDEETGHIRFYADGSSSGGRITMEWGELMYRLDVNWLSGKVDISDE